MKNDKILIICNENVNENFVKKVRKYIYNLYFYPFPGGVSNTVFWEVVNIKIKKDFFGKDFFGKFWTLFSSKFNQKFLKVQENW